MEHLPHFKQAFDGEAPFPKKKDRLHRFEETEDFIVRRFDLEEVAAEFRIQKLHPHLEQLELTPRELIEYGNDLALEDEDMREEEKAIIQDIRNRPITDAEKVEAGVLVKGLYDELVEKYNMPIHAQFVIGRSEETSEKGSKQPHLDILVDSIDGENLDTLKDRSLVSESTREQIGNTMLDIYRSLFDYYKKKYEDGEWYALDVINLRQYVYGKRHRTTEMSEDIYMVDVDIEISKSRHSIRFAMEHINKNLDLLKEYYGVEDNELKKRVTEFQREVMQAYLGE